MEIQVQAKGLPRAAALRQHVSLRLQSALARFSHVVAGVSVRLADINGPERGGMDKLCRAVIRFRDNSVLVVEDLGGDMARVIDRVAERAHIGVARELGRLAPA